MLNRIKKSYEHTIYACYIGYITQAVVNNLVPLLFLTFRKTYGLSLSEITFITTINFLVQLIIDLVSAKFIDRIGYRVAAAMAHVFAATGLIGLAILPEILGYKGIMAAVVLYAIGGGLIEVIISPIVEACPTARKEAAMSLLHSFYCWGHVAVVLLSTVFFRAFGISHWRVLVCIWAVIPVINIVYFMMVPIYPIVPDAEPMSISRLVKSKVFWLLFVIMICAGASEQAMSQWSSAFAEAGLNMSKTVGDLAGPCAFALCMGTARALYGKFSYRIPLKKAMSICALLCVGCYLVAVFSGSAVAGMAGCAFTGFSVGIFWPGTFSIAAGILPTGGTAMYALMALGGDIGCSSGPTLVGLVASADGGRLKTGLLTAIIFPILILVGINLMNKRKKPENRVM